MGILIGKQTRLIVQGITGKQGHFHTRQMMEYGTQVVAGVRPGKGGEWALSLPVFDTVREAVQMTDANASIIFVPAPFAPDAIKEAAAAGIELIVCLTEHIPIQDMLRVRQFISHTDTRLVGPNSPGLITPGQAKIGIMPGHIHKAGPVGVISKSGTLSYEIVHQLSEMRLGQSTVIGIGGDPIIGTTFIDALRLFENDPLTEHVVMIGEVGGLEEQQAAAFIASEMNKPVTAFIAGHTAPYGKQMGHAGAIIETFEETARAKAVAMQKAGVTIAKTPEDVAQQVKLHLA